MGKILVKNSFTAASVPAGLSAGELAVNVIDKKLFVGNAVGGVVTLIDPNALVTSFNGLTGAVTGITAGGANTFTQLNKFSAGISASSGIFGNTGIRVGENVSRFLTITSDGSNNDITQNGNSTLSINHSNNGSIYIGDSYGNNNSTYIDVNDDAATIILHGEVSGTSTTASTSSTTGALIVAGGVGIAKDSYINGHRIGQGLLVSQTNLAVGTSTLNSTLAGAINNTAVGYVAGANITTGTNNTMLGSNAGHSNTTGLSNLCIGTGSHYKNTTGSYNVVIGQEAGFEQNSASVYNTFIGTYSGYNLTSGSNLVCIGGQAGFYQANGVTGLTASSNSVYIGYNAKGFNNSDSNSIVIGSGAIGIGANSTVIGTSSTTAATIYGTLNLPSGLSASGATFSGNVNLQDKTISRVEFLDYFERFVDLGDFATKGGQIPIDLSTGQVFRTKQTVNCSGLTLANVPDNGNANAVGFSLLFVGDGTARTMTWNIGSTAASWAGGTAPTYTSTLNKIDVYSFLSRDGGSTWLGFVGGQNF